jgi:tetratricopeptide (TPR) repeat protein
MRLVSLSVIMLLFIPSFVFAETKEIVAEGTYNMGDGETPSVAESRALLKAKQIALEQAGTYVESYSKVKNFTLTQDEIQVLASGLMEVEILDKKRTIVGDGINFWVKIKAKVSPDNMEKMAKRVKDKSVVEEYERVQEKYDASQKEIEKLKKELTQARDEKEKKKVEAKIAEDEKLFQANEWFEKGKRYTYSYFQYPNKKNYSDEAIEAYASAIALNEKFVEAYIERGNLYSSSGHYDKAISDYSKAIVIKPNDAMVYSLRGKAYYSKHEYDYAIEDYNKAITMEPHNASTYQLRGEAYNDGKGEYDKAIEDYNKVISIYKVQYDKEKSRKLMGNEFVIAGLAGSFASAYVGLGAAYSNKGLYDKAIEECNRAIARAPALYSAYEGLGFNYFKKDQYDIAIENLNRAISLYSGSARAYLYRGMVYGQKQQFDKAIEDFSKAIVIDPNYSESFFFRGMHYAVMGHSDKAIEDFKKACDMGHREACRRLKELLR